MHFPWTIVSALVFSFPVLSFEPDEIPAVGLLLCQTKLLASQADATLNRELQQWAPQGFHRVIYNPEPNEESKPQKFGELMERTWRSAPKFGWRPLSHYAGGMRNRIASTALQSL